jgi:hypothetical protein
MQKRHLLRHLEQVALCFLGKGDKELEIAKQNRDVLREFYGVLKGGNVGKALRFVFLTGISKFARVSIFSELNNLRDLTMHPAYAGLLGYTQEELEWNFAAHITKLSKDAEETEPEALHKLKTWYNGYRFTIEDVLLYNPFSILNVFDTGSQKFFFELFV